LLGGIDQVLIFTGAVFICTELGGVMERQLLIEHFFMRQGFIPALEPTVEAEQGSKEGGNHDDKHTNNLPCCGVLW